MRVVMWLIAVVAAVLALLLGGLGFFMLLVGLNGVSEAKGGTILSGYLILLLLTAVLVLGLSRWGVQALATRTGWSLWVLGPLMLVITVVSTIVVLMVGSVLLLLVVGV